MTHANPPDRTTLTAITSARGGSAPVFPTRQAT